MTEFGLIQAVLMTLETVVSMGPVYLFLLGTFAVILFLWYAWPRLTGRERGRITTREYALIAFGLVLLFMLVLLRWLSLSLWGISTLAALFTAALLVWLFRPFFVRGGHPGSGICLARCGRLLPAATDSILVRHRLPRSAPGARLVLPDYRGLGVCARARRPAPGPRDFRSTPTDRKRPKAAAGCLTTSRPRESHHCNQWVMSGFPVKTKDTRDVK